MYTTEDNLLDLHLVAPQSMHRTYVKNFDFKYFPIIRSVVLHVYIDSV